MIRSAVVSVRVRGVRVGSAGAVRGAIREFRRSAPAAGRAAIVARGPERSNHRSGYRDRLWQTRAAAVDLRTPKLRKGS